MQPSCSTLAEPWRADPSKRGPRDPAGTQQSQAIPHAHPIHSQRPLIQHNADQTPLHQCPFRRGAPHRPDHATTPQRIVQPPSRSASRAHHADVCPTPHRSISAHYEYREIDLLVPRVRCRYMARPHQSNQRRLPQLLDLNSGSQFQCRCTTTKAIFCCLRLSHFRRARDETNVGKFALLDRHTYLIETL